MKLAVIGTGYVGFVSGLCFAEFGFETTCIDKDQSRLATLKKGNSPFFEPGLDELFTKHLEKTKMLSLTNDLANSVKNALVGKGADSDRLETIGYGEDKPLKDNTSREGRKSNRRVQFSLK